MGGCASQNASKQAGEVNTDIAEQNTVESANDDGVNDPLEPINRVVWDFNFEVLDRFLVKPLTKGYIAVTPQFVRTGLLNASENLGEPTNAVNNLLQGKGTDSIASVGRFLVNSTVGIVGIFDVASELGLERKEEDFGQVLGVWGVGTGPYLMLPGLGPNDARSLAGTFVDNVYWPLEFVESPYVIAANVVNVLETRASLLDQEETLNRSLDQYLFVRDAYFQRLAFQVADGKVEARSAEEVEEEADDFSNFEDMLKDL
ncbi:VacJ family lipoprotein [Glaciecola sp. MH2013]|nr:VacJ family lipoprotein [Glaciecola sp. MH2013]